MTGIEAGLAEVQRVFGELSLRYAVIGGLANAVWGEPRSTLDIDVTVRVEEARLRSVIARLADRFQALPADPVEFVRSHSVLPVRSSSGVRIDMIFARLPFEEEVITRAVVMEIGGMRLPICTAEDLILMKIASDRPRDVDDARGVALRRMAALDLEYLERRIRELALLLEGPEILERWLTWKREAGSPGGAGRA